MSLCQHTVDIIFKDVSLTDWKFFLNTWIWLSFSTFGGLKKYPKISGYLDRLSKIWIMKKIDIQSIQVSMYPKETDIHVSKYPCIHVSTISKYPLIQVSKKYQYPRYPSIQISEKSGIRPSLYITQSNIDEQMWDKVKNFGVQVMVLHFELQ